VLHHATGLFVERRLQIALPLAVNLFLLGLVQCDRHERVFERRIQLGTLCRPSEPGMVWYWYVSM
jgi:hypothetical protein